MERGGKVSSNPSTMGSSQPKQTMDTTDNKETDAQRSQKLQNNPFIPPSDGSCPINQLPPEILSCIFGHGTTAGSLDEPDERGTTTSREFCEDEEEGSDEERNQAQEEKGEHETKVIEEERTDSDCQCCERHSELSSDPEIRLPFPFVLSQVCRRWRTVALETPSLWTRIEVSYMHQQPPYSWVTAFLERSKCQPLDICIAEPLDDLLFGEGALAVSKANLEILLTLLVPHIPRWGSIEVRAASYEHMYTFLKAVSDRSIPPASQLRVLQLYHREESGVHTAAFPNPEFSDHFTLFSGSAPRLQSINLWGVHVDWTQSWLRSSNLVELQLAYHTQDVRPRWPTFSAMLRAVAPTLEKLCLEMSGPSGFPGEWTSESGTSKWSDDANNPILLPKLIQLELAFIPPFQVISLLRKLCMPLLKGLTLNFDNEDYTDLVPYLVGPTTAAAATSESKEQPRSLLRGLESLKIAGLPCNSESVQEMYNELVNLESLNLSMFHLSFQFFENLHPQPPPTLENGPPDTTVSYRVLLPRLTTLYTSNVSGYLVRLLVQERQQAGVPLRMVFVRQGVAISSEEESWLKENLEKFDYFEGSDNEDIYEHESLSSSYVSSSSYGGWDEESA